MRWWPEFFVVAAFVFITVFVVAFIVSDISTPGALPGASTPRRPLDVTMAYSCGYMDGISHAPIVPPKHLDWCDEYTKIAHENGFNP